MSSRQNSRQNSEQNSEQNSRQNSEQKHTEMFSEKKLIKKIKDKKCICCRQQATLCMITRDIHPGSYITKETTISENELITVTYDYWTTPKEKCQKEENVYCLYMCNHCLGNKNCMCCTNYKPGCYHYCLICLKYPKNESIDCLKNAITRHKNNVRIIIN
jgi:hypothetical protein